jgi:hypothetical protein
MYPKLTRQNKFRASIAARLKGFTITEVVMASALLLIAMVPILQALTNAHLNTSIIERQTRSLALAQAKLDKIKTLSVYNYSQTFTETSTVLEGSYLCSVVDDTTIATLRKVTVSVGYDTNKNNSLGADEIAVSLVTYIAARW